MPDATVRLANLRADALDLIENVAPSDVAELAADPRHKVVSVMSLGYNRIYINVGKSDRANTPLGRDARVRRAFNLVYRPQCDQRGGLPTAKAIPANELDSAGQPLST